MAKYKHVPTPEDSEAASRLIAECLDIQKRKRDQELIERADSDPGSDYPDAFLRGFERQDDADPAETPEGS